MDHTAIILKEHQWYESYKFGTYTYKVSQLARVDFVIVVQFLALVTYNTQKGESLVRSSLFPAFGEFSRLFSKCFEVSA